jgi:hypothetical protein
VGDVLSPAEVPAGPALRQTDGRGRSAALAALAVVVAISLAPHVMAIARAATSGWMPSGDQAMEILRMHDVGGPNTPLVGPYSRFGWEHPGPLLFWLGAPALRLAGPVGVMVLVGVINVAATIGAVAAARRLAGTSFALVVAAATAVMVHSHGAMKLIDPWNPWVTVLPLLCFLLCVPVAVTRGALWALVAAIASGSFVAQSHLGNVPVVVVATGVGVAWWWRWERTPPVGSEPGRRGAAARLRTWWPLGLVALLWAGPLVDLVVNAPGNLWDLARFAAGATEEPAPLDESLGAAARELGVVPAWMGSNEGVWPVEPAPAWTLLVPPALLLVGLAASRHRSGIYPVRPSGLVVYALAVHVIAAVAVTRTTGGLIPYVLRWTWPVAMLAFLVAVLPLVRLASGHRSARSDRRTAPGSFVLGAFAGVIVVAASVAAVAEGRHDPVEPSPQTDRSVGPLSAAIRRSLPKGEYGLEWRDVRSFSATSIGAGVDLTRHGYIIDFPEDHASRVGEFRATGRTNVPLLLIVGQTPAKLFFPPPGARLVVEWDHLSPEQRARADELEARIRRDAGIDDDTLVAVDTAGARADLVALGAAEADVEELHSLDGDREGYSVWLAPPGTPRTD